jgi:hypothetical protein
MQSVHNSHDSDRDETSHSKQELDQIMQEKLHLRKLQEQLEQKQKELLEKEQQQEIQKQNIERQTTLLRHLQHEQQQHQMLQMQQLEVPPSHALHALPLHTQHSRPPTREHMQQIASLPYTPTQKQQLLLLGSPSPDHVGGLSPTPHTSPDAVLTPTNSGSEF